MSLKREIKTTDKELAYRAKHFHDIEVVRDKQIACASCGDSLSIKPGQIFSHPLMGILQCEEMAGMHPMYGCANGNNATARRLYTEKYPNRKVSSHKLFKNLRQRLCCGGKPRIFERVCNSVIQRCEAWVERNARRIYRTPFTCCTDFSEMDTKLYKGKSRKYCYICGHSNELYVCGNKDCISAFCKECIKRNASSSLLDAENEDWNCFVCKSKPLWELRAICAAAMAIISKRPKRKRIERLYRTLPSQKEKIAKIKQMQKTLRALCDDEEDVASSVGRSFFTARSMEETNSKDHRVKQGARQRKELEIDPINSSNGSESEEDSRRKDREGQKTIQSDSWDSNSSTGSLFSRSTLNVKRVSVKSKDFSDSDQNFIVSSDETSKTGNTRSYKKAAEKLESRKKRAMCHSDSESDKSSSTNKILKPSKSLLKHATQQNKKKNANPHNVKSIKDKKDKYVDTTSELENEDIKPEKQRQKSYGFANSTVSHNSNKKQKREKDDKIMNSYLSQKIQENDSGSSGKEFQKEKLCHSKSHLIKRQLKDVDKDYTKSPNVESSVNEKSKDKEDGQSNPNINNVKEVLSECKNICKEFQKYIKVIEHLYGEDKDKLILKSTQKINKLTTMLGKKQSDLTAFQRSCSKNSTNRKSAAKESHKEVSSDEQSSEETSVHRERTTGGEDKPDSAKSERENKEVSECDSEEIFSADETRTPRKAQVTRDTMDTSKTKDCADAIIDNEDEMLMDKSKDNDESEVNSGDSLIASPVLGASKEKKNGSAEQSNKKQPIPECTTSASNEAQLIDARENAEDTKDPKDDQTGSNNTDVSDNETENSSLRETNKKATSQNDERDNTAASKNSINESIDIFDSSFDILENTEDRMGTPKTDVEANCDKAKPSSKIDSLDNIKTREDEICPTTHDDDDDKISSEKDKTSPLSHHDKEKEDLSSQNNKQAASVTSNENIHEGSSRRNSLKEVDVPEKVDTDESLVDAEALAKKTLLESDSDNDTLDNALSNANVTEQTKNLITDDTSCPKENEAENDSDVSSKSTMILSTFESRKNVARHTGDKDKTKATCKNKDKQDKEIRNETSSSDENEDTRANEDTKKALLESNSDDSIILSSSLEEIVNDKKIKKDVIAIANAEAKEALLASSNSESSNSESIIYETEANISKTQKNNKRNRETEFDSSIISAVKRRKLKHNKYYITDKKLRMSCGVQIARLDKKTLKRYSRTLQKSGEYLEQKALKSLIDLDKLEKRYKKNAKKVSDGSMDDDDDTSSKISERSSKGKGKKATKEIGESLMDYLKRVENDDVSSTIQTDYCSDESVHRVTKVDAIPMSNEALISEANRAAKQNLLNSPDSDAEKEVTLNSDDSINNDDKSEKTNKKSQKKSEEKSSKQDESKKEKSGKSSWRQNKILTMKFSDTDSDAEKTKWDKKQEKLSQEGEGNISDSDDEEKHCTPKKKKKKKARRRILDSDSDIKLTDCSSDSDNSSEASEAEQNSNSDDAMKEKEKQKRKRRKRGKSKSSDTDSSLEEKKSKPKRKRIKKVATDSDSSDTVKTSQGTPGKSGRKNIRKVLKDKQVAEDTKQAAKEEEERLKRIAERQALYNEMYEMRLAGEEKVEKLVLDFDTETKEELVSVHEELVKRLKPHQAQGIKFMWDACFESLERIKKTSGSGCIIAHCMGLGKTLQVIALTHTLLSCEETNVKTVLVVCPLSTVLNWVNEYKTWLKDVDDDITLYELTKFKKNFERKYQLQRWQQTGGVLVIGYEMFRNLTRPNKNIRKNIKEVMLECLIDPGADLIVCDEGHLLKNEDTALSKCMRSVKTLKRIVLTGTPLQNNLIEYHCMVQFVKPNLLGTRNEFLNRFVNPITNGQFDDSTAYDVKLMKKRAHVLHKMLEGCVQRFDYSVLTPFLPPKQEYVIFIRLTDAQIKMYQYYLANLARRYGAGGSLFADFQALQRIWTHPLVLRLNAEKIEKANEKKELSSDSEGSLKDFINDDTDSESSSSRSSSDSDVQAIDDNTKVPKRKTRNNPGVEEEPEPPKEDVQEAVQWWSQFVEPEHFEDIRMSTKLLLLFGILKESEQIGDKVLVFSQSLYTLTLIEEFLRRIDDETQKDTLLDTLDDHTGSWSLGLDYFRLDGQTSAENRSAWCRIFNRPTNTRARLFLISTRAGGLGINLTAANRVIIFDASWNPSHDVQSIFRIYRFGQKKPCYVYRFLAAGTMEEKIYNRQVTKLSLSCRVVDEQQIERHYSNHNLNELYTFEPYDKERPTLNLPKDRLLAEIFLKYKEVVENYHEHDSLLENKAEEELDEEERKQAWLEYEEEKKGKPMVMTNYQNNMLLQQYNMMANSDQSGMMPQNMSLQFEYDNLQQLIRKDYPNATLEQQKMMTNRALLEMYNYWERQAVLQPARNPVTLTNFQPRLTVPHAATNSNAHQISQLGQLLAGQAGGYVNVNQAAQSGSQLVPNPFTYRNVQANNTGKADNDIVEVTPTTSNAGTSNAQIAVQSTVTNKNQEE